MTRHIMKNNPVIDGRPGIRVSKRGHMILRYARKSARHWEEDLGYRATVCRDVVTRRYFCFRSRVKKYGN